MSMIGNLEMIKSLGMNAFVKKEGVRWTCAKCGGALCVHKGICINCGKAYKRKLYQVT